MAKKEKPATKICKHCRTEIPYEAKICPQCRKKQKGGILKWILLLIVVIVIVSAFSGNSKNSGTQKVGTVSDAQSGNNAETAQETAAAQNEDVQTVYHVGDILQDGDLEIVYMSSGEYNEDNEFLQPSDGKKYIYIQLAFKNISDSSDAALSWVSFEGYADGYSADMYYGGEDTLASTLSPGRSVSAYLYFEVPEDAKEIEIEYETNFFTEDKITFVYDGESDSGYTLEANTEETEGALSVGESFEDKNVRITYEECFRDDSNNQFIQPKEGYHFMTCKFEFENISDSDQTVSEISFDCFADGIDCDAAYFRDDAINATLSAGRKAVGTVTFEVPDDAQTVEVEYVNDFWTSGRVVFTAAE